MENFENKFISTPQLNDFDVKGSGDPFQLRGLNHVISSIYKEGMSLDDLQTSLGTALQSQLTNSYKSLDSNESQNNVYDYLQNVDSALLVNYQDKIIVDEQSDDFFQ